MFCDLVGSTELSNRLDPEDLRNIITRYQEVCQKVVSRFEGHIAQYLGDGILVYFGYPVAHENDAHRAASSGLGIIEAVKQLSARLSESSNVQISVRIGIHTGHVVIGELGTDAQSQNLALGATPNIAARIESIAKPDTVCISSSTYRLIERYFNFQERGEHSLKGVPEPVEVFRVVSENVARNRFETYHEGDVKTPLIGRKNEFQELLGLWEKAKEQDAKIVLINGEPGVGKSRLIHELMKTVADDSSAWMNVHHCSQYHRETSFYPFADTVKNVALKLTEEESTDNRITKLEGFLIQYGFDLDEILPLFANILSIPLHQSNYRTTAFSVEQQQQKIIGAFIDIFLQRARKQNLLLVFEDVQWMDQQSLEILTQLMNQPTQLNMLTVISYRMDFNPPWRSKPHIVPITVSNLEGDAVETIIQEIAGSKQVPREAVDLIIKKTDGVPLFVEELTKMMIDTEILFERDDHYELTPSVSSISIPATLHDSLVARLDKMSHAKMIAQIGAVIGREFNYELLKFVCDLNDDALIESLNQLVSGEVLYQNGVAPNASFKFKHALIRDVAYQSLLKAQQQRNHVEIAEVMTEKLVDYEDSPELIAFHFEKGGKYKEAIEYSIKSAHKLREHLAYGEALIYIGRGLELLNDLGDSVEEEVKLDLELKLLIIKAPLLIMSEGFVSKPAYEASLRLSEIALKLKDQMSLFRALRGVATYELFSGKTVNAHKNARKSLKIAETLGQEDALMEAYRLVGQTAIYNGELDLSLEAFNSSISLSKSQKKTTISRLIGADPEVFALTQSSHVLWYLGYPDQALERCNEAIAKANELDRPYSQVLSRFIGALVNCQCGNVTETDNYSRSCIKIAEEYGIKMFIGEGTTFFGWSMLCKGQEAEAIRLMTETIDNRLRNNLFSGIWLHLSVLASACHKTGRTDAGLKAINETMELVSNIEDNLCLSEIYRLKAELLMQKNAEAHLEEAIQLLDQSMGLAKRQNARSFQLRTAISRTKFSMYQDKASDALDELKEIYDWFDEGLETKDLKDARLVIEELTLALESES